jgi:hypothetical protein
MGADASVGGCVMKIDELLKVCPKCEGKSKPEMGFGAGTVAREGCAGGRARSYEGAIGANAAREWLEGASWCDGGRFRGRLAPEFPNRFWFFRTLGDSVIK